jgi:hypothetical protein
MRRALVLLALVAAAFVTGPPVEAQVLLSDTFTGTVIDSSKWSVYHDPDGGTLTQNGKIHWNPAGSTTWTGHGLITQRTFQDGGTYVVEADWEVDDYLLHAGEGGTGLNFTPVSPARETQYYGSPLHSIRIHPMGLISYSGDSYDDVVLLNTKNTITGRKPAGHQSDIFYETRSTVVHLRVELDTDAGTIRCWANGAADTFAEASIPSNIWQQVVGASGQFRVEEYRAWCGDQPTIYAQHRLDNWSISRAGGDCTPCDANGDGVVNVLDLQQLVNVILGIDQCGP